MICSDRNSQTDAIIVQINGITWRSFYLATSRLVHRILRHHHPNAILGQVKCNHDSTLCCSQVKCKHDPGDSAARVLAFALDMQLTSKLASLWDGSHNRS